MSQTKQKLERGQYAYSSHSLRLAGHIVDTFVGKWEQYRAGLGRRLLKFPPNTEVTDGQLMCLLKLRNPIHIKEYRDISHPSIRPVTENINLPIKVLLMYADVVCTIPDGM